MGSRSPAIATLATYYGPRMETRGYQSLREAVASADAAVMLGGADLAAVRDDHGVLVYAADSAGRTWSRGEPAAKVATMGAKR